MGRYGNQIDQLLGSLHFAKRTGRIFVAPPLVNWGAHKRKGNYFLEFQDVFNISALNKYHPSIPMQEFMELREQQQAGKMPIHCIDRAKKAFDTADCRLTPGQARGDFWTHYNVPTSKAAQQVLSLTYQSQDSEISRVANAQRVPVLAFAGASQIAKFPMLSHLRNLHRFVCRCCVSSNRFMRSTLQKCVVFTAQKQQCLAHACPMQVLEME